MTTQNTPANAESRLKSIQPRDIKNLIAQQGKVTEGNTELTLKEPYFSDSRLQAVLNDPSCQIKPTSQAQNGEMSYDLAANGQNVTVKVTCQTRQ